MRIKIRICFKINVAYVRKEKFSTAPVIILIFKCLLKISQNLIPGLCIRQFHKKLIIQIHPFSDIPSFRQYRIDHIPNDRIFRKILINSSDNQQVITGNNRLVYSRFASEHFFRHRFWNSPTIRSHSGKISFYGFEVNLRYCG